MTGAQALIKSLEMQGVESMYALASGVTMLVAPGPLVTIATPGRPVAMAYPSAI